MLPYRGTPSTLLVECFWNHGAPSLPSRDDSEGAYRVRGITEIVGYIYIYIAIVFYICMFLCTIIRPWDCSSGTAFLLFPKSVLFEGGTELKSPPSDCEKA